MQHDALKACGWKFLNSIQFSFISIITVLLGRHYPALQVMGMASLVATATATIWLVSTDQLRIPVRSQWRTYAVRVMLGLISFGIWCEALRQAPAHQAIAISYFIPLLTTGLSYRYTSDSPSLRIILSLALGLVGALCIVRPQFSGVSYGIILAIIASVMWAFNDLMVKSQTYTEHAVNQVFWLIMPRTILLIPLMMLQWQPFRPEDSGLIVVLGILYVSNLASLFLAYCKVPLSWVMPVSFSRIIISTLLAFFILHESIDPLFWLGLVIITISHFFLVQFMHKNAKV